MLLRFLIVSGLLALVSADICPYENHTICNEDIDTNHACICALGHPENPPPEKSCSLLVDILDDKFPAVSVTFKLDEAARSYNHFPENKFKEEIGSALKEETEDIIILREGCNAENDQLTVQFVIKHNDAESAVPPYLAADFIDPEDIVKKMKVIGFLSQIADLDVDDVKVVGELIDVDGHIDNNLLVIQAAVAGAFIVITIILGTWLAMRSSGEEYSEELQKI